MQKREISFSTEGENLQYIKRWKDLKYYCLKLCQHWQDKQSVAIVIKILLDDFGKMSVIINDIKYDNGDKQHVTLLDPSS